MLAALVLAATIGETMAQIPAGPPGDAFYVPPSSLTGTRGNVIWDRALVDGAALPSAAANYLVLYETQSPRGEPVAVSGTLAVPRGTPPPGGWPIISWAHGTVGNAPQCAPSRGAVPNFEQRMLDTFVARGYAVAQTDYEGNGTPGIHPYLVALASANDVGDIVRASREINPAIGRNWIAMGHSEGGAAALATAAIDPRSMLDLHLLGAVAFAPLAYPEDVFRSEMANDTPNGGFPIVGLMIDGFSSFDPRIVPAEMLEPQALALMADFSRYCLSDIDDRTDWVHVIPRAMFRPQGEAALEAFYNDLAASDPANFAISVPTLMLQGSADALIMPESTMSVAAQLRRRGTPVTLRAYVGGTHGSILELAEDDVAAWIAGLFTAAGTATPPDHR